MASKNQVTLTLAGDSTQLEQAFSRVGAASKKMSDEVGEAGKGFDRAADATDALDTKAMGFRDTVTGVQDSVKGFGMILKGDLSADALVTAGTGVGDLASGFTNLLVPAMGSAVSWLGKTKLGTMAVSAATKAWMLVQGAFNVVMMMNPIGLVILAVVALIGIIVLIATKTTWFQDLWRVVWTWIKDTAIDVWDWLKTLPDKIGSAFKAIYGFIIWPFRTAFNFIADAWNNTIGKLSWTVPGWVPIIGGNTISVPHLPKYHAGGVVPGAPGSEMLAVLQAGERVTPAGSGGRTVLELRSSGSRVDDLLVEILARAVKGRGGNVQVVLGR